MNRHEEFTVGDRPAASIEIRSGALEVRTGDVGHVRVSLDGPDVDQWAVAQLGDSISVEPPSRGGWRTRSTRVLVEVPVGADVDVRSASADITLSGDFGATRIKSASGDVRVGTVARLDIDTASGDATATAVGAVTSCSTASGDVDLGRVGGRLTVSTASGDVRVTEADDDVEIGSASGDVRVEHRGQDDLRRRRRRSAVRNPGRTRHHHAQRSDPPSRTRAELGCRVDCRVAPDRASRPQDRVRRHHDPTGRRAVTAH